MSETHLDLNLIPYLVAMEDTRNVSRAAEQLGVSQPRVSTALGRLREYFDDPLFVRTSKGMEPTPRALAILPAARDALLRIEKGMLDVQDFDPATSTHTFSIALSDVGEIVFLPRLLQLFAERAPFANLRSVSLSPSQVERGLESGDVDLAVGYFPDLAGNNFFQQRLFTHRFICLMRIGASAVEGAAHARAVRGVGACRRARRGTQPGSPRTVPGEEAHQAPRGTRNAALHEPAVHPRAHRSARDGAARDRLRVRVGACVDHAGRAAAAVAAFRSAATLASQVS